MAYIPLRGGAYQNRSLLASAQRCVNLYIEPTPASSSEPILHAHYPTPGTVLLHNAPTDICRCAYTATNGDLYMVYGQGVYYVNTSWRFDLVGTMTPSTLSDVVPRSTPVYITDNGINLVIADGSVDGWTVIMSTRSGFARIDVNEVFVTISSSTPLNGGASYTVGNVLTLIGTGGAQVTVSAVAAGTGAVTAVTALNNGGINSLVLNPVLTSGGTGSGCTLTCTFNVDYVNGGWLGSPRIDYQDGFILASSPGTADWYVSGANAVTFDALQIATKSSVADNIVGLASVHRDVWIFGEYSYEIWVGAGNDITVVNQFPFEPIPNAMGNWGCASVYSIATIFNQVFWLSHDRSGKGMVFVGEAISAKRISTFAIENAISSYSTITDAVGYCYQQEGHVFYVLNFPSANDFKGVTWVYDSTVGEWHERLAIVRVSNDPRDNNGIEYRHRIQCATQAYGYVVGGDWDNSNLYKYDLDVFTDVGQPIVRIRSLQHQLDLNTDNRVFYKSLRANMQVGSESSNDVPSMTIINCSFDDVDGTLMQDYFNKNDTGATFSYASGTVNAEILSNAMVAVADGNFAYLASGQPTVADYLVRYNVNVTNHVSIPANTASVFTIGRANGSNNGYKASVTSNGSNMFVNLVVMGGATTTVSLGVLSTGYYEVSLLMQGTSISVSVYRSSDGKWLNPTATWSDSSSTAISITDATYSDIGRVLIGGVAA